MPGLIKDNFDEIVVRKGDVACCVGNAEPELTIPFDHAPLGLAVDAGVSLQSAKLDAGLDHALRKTPAAKLGAHGQPLKLGEIREAANAQRGSGLMPDITEQVRSERSLPSNSSR